MEHRNMRGNITLGIILLIIGVMAFVGQVAGAANGIVWPVVVIAVGLAFFVAMAAGGRSMGFLAIPGAIIAGVGMTLLLQNLFHISQFAVYGWTMVVCSVGIGLVIAGKWSDRPDMIRAGWKVAQVGLTLFLVFGILIEMVFNLGGSMNGLAALFWPLALIALGLVLLALRSYRLVRGGEAARWHDVNLFWPVMFIGAGFLWMLVRQGALEAAQLMVVINLWPLLLIAAGVNILVGQHFQWANLLLGIVVVASMFYVIYNAPALGLSQRTPWGVFGISTSQTQPVREWVTGSGETAVEKREMKAFDKINLMMSGEMEVAQGQEYSIRVEAEENLLPFILAEVQGSQLVIRTKPGVAITSTGGIRFFVTVKDLSAVTLTGAGTIKSRGLETNSLNLSISGFGTLQFDELKAETVNIQMNGMGTILASGTTDEVIVKINGTGNVNLPDLKAQRAEVTISGMGSATVWAVDRLDAKVNGAGTVSYFGSPQTQQTANGLGSLKKLGDK